MLCHVRRRNENAFPYKAQVLERSFAILDVLAESTEDLSLADMEERLDLNKSTSYRLLRTLERHRFAEKDFGTGKYRLGSKLLELGARAVARFDLVTIGRPFLEKLATQSGETAHLGVLSGREVVSIAVANGRHNLRMSVTVGGKAPVHCSSLGKAILALLPENEVDSVLGKEPLRAHTRHTMTRRLDLKAELAQIRTRGFAIDDEELEDGLKCIGAGIQDYSGRVVGALSLAGAALRLNKKRVASLAPLVARMASEFSLNLGYRPATVGSNGHSRS